VGLYANIIAGGAILGRPRHPTQGGDRDSAQRPAPGTRRDLLRRRDGARRPFPV